MNNLYEMIFISTECHIHVGLKKVIFHKIMHLKMAQHVKVFVTFKAVSKIKNSILYAVYILLSYNYRISLF